MTKRYSSLIFIVGVVIYICIMGFFSSGKHEEFYNNTLNISNSTSNEMVSNEDLTAEEFINLARSNIPSDSMLNNPNPDYNLIVVNLFNGLQNIDLTFDKAKLLRVEEEILDVRRNYVTLVKTLFDLTDDEITATLQLPQTEREQKLKDYTARLEMKQIIRDAAPIKILDESIVKRGDYVYVTAAAKNIGSTPHSYIKVKVTFVDKNENVIDTDWTYVNSSDVLHPNEQKYFETMTKYRNGMEKYSLTIESFE